MLPVHIQYISSSIDIVYWQTKMYVMEKLTKRKKKQKQQEKHNRKSRAQSTSVQPIRMHHMLYHQTNMFSFLLHVFFDVLLRFFFFFSLHVHFSVLFSVVLSAVRMMIDHVYRVNNRNRLTVLHIYIYFMHTKQKTKQKKHTLYNAKTMSYLIAKMYTVR